MLKKIGLGLLVVVAALAAYISSRPDAFRVERSAQVVAPPQVVFTQVNDFHKWQGWSPWEKLDLTMKKSFEGPESGVGAKYSWAGNDKVGEGRMTITESRPGEKVGIKLEFLKPWTATNDTSFTFAPEGAGTKVTWAMEGRNNFMLKAMSVFSNMDAMIGKDFESGLASLKEQSEAEARRLAEAAAKAAATAQAAAATAQAAAAQAAAAQAVPAAGAPKTP